jgi:hypothetical protein
MNTLSSMVADFLRGPHDASQMMQFVCAGVVGLSFGTIRWWAKQKVRI